MIRSVKLGIIILFAIVLVFIGLEYFGILYAGTIWGIFIGMILFVANGVIIWYRFDYSMAQQYRLEVIDRKTKEIVFSEFGEKENLLKDLKVDYFNRDLFKMKWDRL